jgi:hypothetical protein
MIERNDALSQRSPDNLSACVTVDGQTVSDGLRPNQANADCGCKAIAFE